MDIISLDSLKELPLNELFLLSDNVKKALKEKQDEERKSTYKKIRQLAESVGATVEIQEKNKKAIKKVSAKYRNPENPDQTWTGRGLMPVWMRSLINDGQDKENFLIT